MNGLTSERPHLTSLLLYPTKQKKDESFLQKILRAQALKPLTMKYQTRRMLEGLVLLIFKLRMFHPFTNTRSEFAHFRAVKALEPRGSHHRLKRLFSQRHIAWPCGQAAC